MSPELAKKLCEDFPHLTQDYGGDPRVTCLAWGFDIGDGWHDLFRAALEEIEVERRELPPEQANMIKLAQVKEKFGAIRIYMTGETPEITEAIRRAAKRSAETCEVCGAPGTIAGTSWLQCLCAGCRGKRV